MYDTEVLFKEICCRMSERKMLIEELDNKRRYKYTITE
jgi:hypothetical protein